VILPDLQQISETKTPPHFSNAWGRGSKPIKPIPRTPRGGQVGEVRDLQRNSASKLIAIVATLGE
jgi:hypothetical protein